MWPVFTVTIVFAVLHVPTGITQILNKDIYTYMICALSAHIITTQLMSALEHFHLLK